MHCASPSPEFRSEYLTTFRARPPRLGRWEASSDRVFRLVAVKMEHYSVWLTAGSRLVRHIFRYLRTLYRGTHCLGRSWYVTRTATHNARALGSIFSPLALLGLFRTDTRRSRSCQVDHGESRRLYENSAPTHEPAECAQIQDLTRQTSSGGAGECGAGRFVVLLHMLPSLLYSYHRPCCRSTASATV